MRAAGQLESEEQARMFADYLFGRGIEAQLEPGKGAGQVVWVVDEDRVDEAKALLSRFRSMPDAEEFHQAAAAAAERRRGEEAEIRAEVRKLRRAAVFPGRMPGGGLTTALLLLCVAAGLGTLTGRPPAWAGFLMISGEKVAQGELWRLFTPIFLHFTPWHLLVNLLWLQDLGGALEGRIGTWRFAGVVAFLALVSNAVQYQAGGGAFGGMSGVIYGLFGYLWTRGRLDDRFGVFLSPLTSGLLLVFLALGIFGLAGPTANAAHFSGLLAGAGLGWVAAKPGRGA